MPALYGRVSEWLVEKLLTGTTGGVAGTCQYYISIHYKGRAAQIGTERELSFLTTQG